MYMGSSSLHGDFFRFDAPGASPNQPYGVMGALINGINDRGDIVGFFPMATGS
jgi:hypothetical protein